MRVGVIGRPHGVRGALKIHLDNPDGETLHPGLQIHLQAPALPPAKTARELDDVIVTLGSGIVTLKAVPDRNAAERLVGAVVWVRREDFKPDQDAVYLIDTIGKDVVDGVGVVLGKIMGFSTNGAQPLAEVLTPAGKRVLVPFVSPIVREVGVTVILDVPEGLFSVDD